MNEDRKTIRILQIIPGGQVCGGIENFVMNYYRNIDRTKVQFDFLVHYNEKGYYDDEILKLGGKIYYTNVRNDKKILKYIKFLYNLFKEHKEYKIIHGHMPGLAPIYFGIAKARGVKIRIAHSHVTDTEKTIKGRILKVIIKNIKFFSNIYFACSEEAGKFMFQKRKFIITKNAIDFDKFAFNEIKRENIRKKLEIEDSFVIGCVARFNQQKNHTFLLDIFSEILKIKKNSKLVLIGEGQLEKEIMQKANKLGIVDKIKFLGVIENVHDYYNAFDVFVLPSNFEGLGIVMIEAQVNGLQVFTSTAVPKEAEVSKLIKFIPLEKDAMYWAKKITSSDTKRKDVRKEIEEKGYNIKKEVIALENKYLQFFEGDNNERKF